MNRDAVLLSLPTAADCLRLQFPRGRRRGCRGPRNRGTLAVALGNLLAEDVVYGLSWNPVPPTARLVASRLH